MEDFITVRVSKKKGVFKVVPLFEFTSLLKRNALDVDMEFDCKFSRRKMLQGSLHGSRIGVEIFIEDIKHIEYLHD